MVATGFRNLEAMSVIGSNGGRCLWQHGNSPDKTEVGGWFWWLDVNKSLRHKVFLGRSDSMPLFPLLDT